MSKCLVSKCSFSFYYVQCSKGKSNSDCNSDKKHVCYNEMSGRWSVCSHESSRRSSSRSWRAYCPSSTLSLITRESDPTHCWTSQHGQCLIILWHSVCNIIPSRSVIGHDYKLRYALRINWVPVLIHLKKCDSLVKTCSTHSSCAIGIIRYGIKPGIQCYSRTTSRRARRGRDNSQTSRGRLRLRPTRLNPRIGKRARENSVRAPNLWLGLTLTVFVFVTEFWWTACN